MELIREQNQMMADQDAMLGEMSDSIARLKEYGKAIGGELDRHNELLDGLGSGVDRTQVDLHRGSKKAQNVSANSGGCAVQ
jgi:hypothetical protein